MTIYCLLALLPMLYSCTKETYVEHIEVEKVQKQAGVLNQQFALTEELSYLNIDIFGKPYNISIRAYRMEVSPAYWPTYQVSLGDSILIVYLFDDQISIDGVDGGIFKYDEGKSLITPTPVNVATGLYAAYRNAPFLNGYVFLEYLQGTYYNFSVKDQGYIGFRLTAGNKTIRGWIEVELTESTIRFNKYGYYTNTLNVFAGQ